MTSAIHALKIGLMTGQSRPCRRCNAALKSGNQEVDACTSEQTFPCLVLFKHRSPRLPGDIRRHILDRQKFQAQLHTFVRVIA